MKITTLCFLHTDKDILLAMKKRGFGVGRMNGVGGKIKEDESIEQATIREAFEEIEVTIPEDKLEKVAILHFSFDSKPEWDQECHVYFVSEWEGEPIESEEMNPEWYSKDNLPFDNMWPDDKHWLPRVLSGERVRGHFSFTEDHKMKEDFAIQPLLD